MIRLRKEIRDYSLRKWLIFWLTKIITKGIELRLSKI